MIGLPKKMIIGDVSLISDKQKQFFTAKTKHVGFGGARGGGKSWAVRAKAKMLAERYPGIRILIVRRSYPELMNNHIEPLRIELNGFAVFNKTDKMFKFPNGSTIKFGYCSNDGDLGQYQGAEYDIIFIDEAGLLQEMWIKSITACLRGTNGYPKRIYYTCNPGGPAHGYLKRLFIDKKYEEGERPEDYTFIKSLVTDNRALMMSQPDYIHQLEALPSKLRDAWLYGNWDIFEGQFFEDFVIDPPVSATEETGLSAEELRSQHRYCHVIPPIDLSVGEQRGWNIMRSYDFGYGKPFSCAWWAIDYDGVLYRIMELYGCTNNPNEGVKWSPDQQFAEISKIENEHPWLRGKTINGVADPSIWDASRGESIADTALKYGLYFRPGDNQRIPGWMQVHYRLQFDKNGYARMYFFDCCKAAIRTIPLMIYSNTRPEDLDTTLEDHCADEIRYMCMSRPIKPEIPIQSNPILIDPLDQFRKRRYD